VRDQPLAVETPGEPSRSSGGAGPVGSASGGAGPLVRSPGGVGPAVKKGDVLFLITRGHCVIVDAPGQTG